MARRLDSGWRDGLLAVRHSYWGFDAPAPGMTFPMIEYDRGEPLAVISYMQCGGQLPTGREVAAAYRAFGNLYRETGEQLPFFTVQYDPRNWAYRMFGHNESARAFLDRPDWVAMTEFEFVKNLYRLRGRYMPDLSPLGVDLSWERWVSEEMSREDLARLALAEPWPGQLMSERRRNFEPVGQVRMSWRNPCLDVDLAVVDRDDNVALLVDYKAPGARINLGSTNVAALSKLFVTSRSYRSAVPAMVVSYEPTKPAWGFRVHCVNEAARLHLSYTLGANGADVDKLSATIAGAEWVDLSEAQWQDVLRVARDV